MTQSHPPSPKTTARTHAISSQVESVAQSLRNASSEIGAIEAAAQRLSAAGNERAALGEQVNAATEAMATSIEQTSAMTAKTLRAQQGLTELAQTLLSDVEE